MEPFREPYTNFGLMRIASQSSKAQDIAQSKQITNDKELLQPVTFYFRSQIFYTTAF